jgi:DNA-binding XRE family transcriptional regulator
MSVSDITEREPIPELPPASERKRLREHFGVTQKELAESVGVSRQTVVAWERGSEPNGNERVKYARILNRWKIRLGEPE